MITDTPANDLETQDAAGAFRESFESFYAREVRKLIGLAYVLSGSRLAAEDLAQDALLAAYRDWERVGRYDNPGAWVRRVVSNRAVSRLRRRTSEAKAVLRVQRDEYTVPEIDAGAIHLWDEVRRLPTRQAQAVALRYFDRGTIAEIASILGCSENTVKTHLSRAKETLQRRLTEEFK